MARLTDWLSSSLDWFCSPLLAPLRRLVTRLANWLCTGRAWSVSANWFPLLILALLWILVAWYHLNLFPDTVPPAIWPFLALGSTAYLLMLAYFLLSSNHDRLVGVSTRTAMALAMGAATIFSVYAWNEWPKETNFSASPASNQSNTSNLSNASKTTSSCSVTVPTPLSKGKPSSVSNKITSCCINTVSAPLNEIKSENEDSLSLVNIFAAILGIVLAAVALIAQKSAVDAKTEAEKARKDILEALNIKVVALSSLLLAYAQAAKSEAQELSNESYEIGSQDQDLARFLSRRSTGLNRLAKLFMLLHHWILAPRLIPTTDLAGCVALLKLDLPVLGTNQSTLDREKRLRIEYWRPAGRLIDNLLDLNVPNSAVPTEAEKVILQLQEVRATLDQL